MNIRSIGIDLGKTTFHLVALGERGKVIVRKKAVTQATVGIHGEHEPRRDWHGGLFGLSLSGPRFVATRP